ncbi:MAG: ATP-grasp domain-containing protein [Eubacterium sp.]|nr:ATP-grasp domain-containing protein [Eubacterium sp.]
MKKIMILGASILQLPAIEKSIEMGHQCIAIDMDPDAIGFSVPGVIREVISTIDTERVMEAAERHQIDGIMTLASDMPMMTVAAVCEKMNLPGVTKETALKATNKSYMREALKAAGVPIPIFHIVHDFDEFKAAVKDILSKGYKCIVKPADNSGSRGISFVEKNQNSDTIASPGNDNGISAASDEKYRAAYEYTKSFSKTGVVLVEECMEGPEVSVETLSVDGECHVIQITDKITTEAPYFVEMGHTQPSRLPKDVQDEIRRVTKAACKAIGITTGPSHTEIKITKDGPKIVELGARLGGDNITTFLVPLSTGVDMVECCIRLALGEKADITPKKDKGSAIRYFKNDVGVITGINGVDEAGNSEGIVNVTIVHDVGETAKEIRSSNDRVGFVIAEGNDADDAETKCEKALSCISVGIK